MALIVLGAHHRTPCGCGGRQLRLRRSGRPAAGAGRCCRWSAAPWSARSQRPTSGIRSGSRPARCRIRGETSRSPWCRARRSSASLYFLTNVAYLCILPGATIAAAPEDRVGTLALQAIFGAPGLYVMAAAIMLSCFGCNAAIILSAPRVYYAMARDGLFFRAAGRLHPRYRTPAVALAVQAVWASVLCLSGSYGQLLDYMVFVSLLFYILTVSCLFALRIKRPEVDRPVKAVGYPVLPGTVSRRHGAALRRPARREAAIHVARTGHRRARHPRLLRVADACPSPRGRPA